MATETIDEFSDAPETETWNLGPTTDLTGDKIKRMARLLARAKGFLPPGAFTLIRDIEDELQETTVNN